MNITKFKNAVTSKAARQVLLTRKHSPAILFAAGVVGVVGTAVLAARATLKVEEVLEEHEKTAYSINELAQMEADSVYSEDDRKKDMVLLYVKTAARFGKLYGPAFLCGAASIAALTGSHVVLNRRYAAAVAAYAASNEGFRKYRERVAKALGAERELEFNYDRETETVVETMADGKTKEMEKIRAISGLSQYAMVFDESSSTSWKREHGYNQLFIQCQQNYANDLLRARGHVFLNEVLDSLGMERVPYGQLVGWVAGKGDDFVDFGVFRGDTWNAQNFVNGDEKSIILDFNVAGEVWKMI
jgi:uncharacterized protein DUF6353